MSERLAFIQACLERRVSVATLCARFGISEKTGYKYLARFRIDGMAGLVDRSHAPRTHPNAVRPAVEARIVALRREHPLYGASKLRDWLVQHHPDEAWPAASTIGELLTRHKLIPPQPPRRRRAHARLAPGRTPATAPNVVWTADFKGQFRLGTQQYCYPLTVLDLHTHFLLGCVALPSTAAGPAQQQFTRLFREYGLPEVLRTDNGVPFAQPNALGRLGALAWWCVRLGIRPEHTRPATPSDNGAHERFHRTLDLHTVHPPAGSLGTQQRRFDVFRPEYNTDRPHEGNPDHWPPATRYQPSPRPYPAKLPTLEYSATAHVRLVDLGGAIKFRARPLFLSTNLVGQRVGLFDTGIDTVQIRYGQLILGELDYFTHRFAPNVRWVDSLTDSPLAGDALSPG